MTSPHASPRAARQRRYRALRALALALSIALGAGTLIADTALDQAAAQASDEEFFRCSEVFNEIFQEIQSKYVDPVDTRTLMEAAIQGMFRALDPHSQYMGPQLYDQLTQSTRGEFFGIGIHITIRDGVLTVIAPIPDSPSARLGIQPWDRIIEIEGESTEGMTLDEAISRLKGPRGTQVTIRVFRAPQEPGADPQYLDFTITRDEIVIQSVFSSLLNEKVGYVRIAQFSDDTGQDLRHAIRELTRQGAQALILDLRFNTGGLLSQAVEVADLFLPRGALIVSTDGRQPTQVRRYFSENDAYTDLPMLVLVNNGSASASEIVAGALQDHGRALIVGPEGQKTFGKGTVQTIEELRNTLDYDEDGNPRPAAIRLTTARYLTPSGRQIHNLGITPDIEIPLPPGHEVELFRRGLLGDPNTIESEEHLRAVQEGIRNGTQPPRPASPEAERPEAEEPTESESPQADSVREVDIREETMGASPEAEQEFRDILLDEAVRHLEVFLLMRREAA